MSQDKLAYISFELKGQEYASYISFDGLIDLSGNPEERLQKASHIYLDALSSMRSLIQEIKSMEAIRRPVPGRLIWQLGNAIFLLRDHLKELSLQIDGMYVHLERDLKVKRKWLEKVVILRRYIAQQQMIPESLNWGYFEKGTRKKAEDLLQR